MRPDDFARAALMHAGARWTVRYGASLTFAGQDLPAPTVVRVPTRHGDVPVHVYRPRGAGPQPLPAYVHFHGGAFLMRYPEMDDFWCRYVAARAGAVVCNVDFRAGPYVQYPVAQHQGHDAAAWLAERGDEVGVDGRRLVVGGFSSGGGLAASVCLQARDGGTFRPLLQVLGVPALDLCSEPEDGDRSMVSSSLRALVRRVYFPDPETRREPYASPLLAPDLRDLPSAVILTAELDALRPDADRYVARLRAAGVPVLHDMTPGADHYFLSADPVRARATMATTASAIAGAVGVERGLDWHL